MKERRYHGWRRINRKATKMRFFVHSPPAVISPLLQWCERGDDEGEEISWLEENKQKSYENALFCSFFSSRDIPSPSMVRERKLSLSNV